MALEEYKELVGLLATVITILNFLVGSQVCYQFVKKKTTGDVSGLTFLVGVMMTFSWWSYGRMVEDSSITLVNGVGLILQTLYSICYFSYSSERCGTTTTSTIFTITFILILNISINSFEPAAVKSKLGNINLSIWFGRSHPADYRKKRIIFWVIFCLFYGDFRFLVVVVVYTLYRISSSSEVTQRKQ